MTKAALGTLLVVWLALPVLADNGPEEGKRPQPNAIAVSELLKRSAESPLGPGTAGLLRAVADLLEKEPAHAPSSRVLPPVAASSAPVAASPAMLPMDPIKPVPTEQRQRLAIRLRHAPAVDVAKAVEEFLASQRKAQERHSQGSSLNRVVFVPEPVSNCLLISGPPKMVDSLTELVAKLDTQPDMVMVSICIAELLLSSDDAKTDNSVSGDSARQEAPSMQDDGAAWLAWAEKHGHLEILSRPQIMTLDNQPAFIQVGSIVPMVASKPATKSPAEADRIEQAEVGLIVALTPRISPVGSVVMELDLQRKSVVNRDKQSGPTIQKTTVRTTVLANDGQTIVQGGVVQRTEDGRRQLIIALTPQINPMR